MVMVSVKYFSNDKLNNYDIADKLEGLFARNIKVNNEFLNISNVEPNFLTDEVGDMLDFLRESNVPSKTDKHNDIYTTHRFIMGVEGRGTCHLESLEINSKFQELCEVLKRYITKQKIKI